MIRKKKEMRNKEWLAFGNGKKIITKYYLRSKTTPFWSVNGKN